MTREERAGVQPEGYLGTDVAPIAPRRVEGVDEL
jgi:hypothetical protein